MRRIVWVNLAASLVLAFLAQATAAAHALDLRVLASGYINPVMAPPDGIKVGAGETITLVLTIPGAKFSHGVTLPSVDGLRLDGTGSNPFAHTLNFGVTPLRKGVLVVPAFDIRADDGQSYHVNALKLRAGG